jgi:hypothetical protein
VFTLARPAAAAGLTLLAGGSPPALPRAMDVEVSSDGREFARIGRRRAGRETVDLAWINGHPQFLTDDVAFSVPLDGRVVAAIRITPLDGRPWSVAEILVHPRDVDGPWSPLPPAASAPDAISLYRAALALPRR